MANIHSTLFVLTINVGTMLTDETRFTGQSKLNKLNIKCNGRRLVNELQIKDSQEKKEFLSFRRTYRKTGKRLEDLIN